MRHHRSSRCNLSDQYHGRFTGITRLTWSGFYLSNLWERHRVTHLHSQNYNVFKQNIWGREAKFEEARNHFWKFSFFQRVRTLCGRKTPFLARILSDWLRLGGGLLLCTKRGRLLDCKPTFSPTAAPVCKRVVSRLKLNFPAKNSPGFN